MKAQRGGFVLGLIVGLLVGLALALGVALYITKVPVPFIDKVPQRTAEQDSAEAARNKNWNPNAPLAEKIMPPPAAGPAASAASEAAAAASMPAVAATPPVTPAPAATPAHPGEDPAAILSGAPEAQPFVYYIQVGAFTRAEEAEQQRAKMAIIGYATKVTRQSQSGRDVYRVRLGPYETRDEAESTQARLQDANVDGAKFKQLYDSFQVATKARQAQQLTDAYKLDGVPTLGLQGLYTTSGAQAGSFPRSLQVADFLIQRVRSGA